MFIMRSDNHYRSHRITRQAFVRTLLPLILLGALCACRDSQAQSAVVGNSGAAIRDATLSLPKDSSPTGVYTTRSLSIIVKTGDITPADRYRRSLYAWEPGKQPKFIVGGHFLDVTRLSDDTFAAYYFDNKKEAIVTLNSQGLISQPLMLPQGGPTGWGGCDGNTRIIVCIGNPPGTSFDYKEYDEMGFSAVLVIDLEQRKTSWFPVKHQTYFHFDPALKLIYVGDLAAPSMNSPLESFDLAGNRRGRANVWNTSLSPSGHFAGSLQEDGSESWKVYDVASKKVLLAFHCDKPECKLGDQIENHYWNPVFDGQVVALNSGGAYGKGGTCDVYQTSPPRLVKREFSAVLRN